MENIIDFAIYLDFLTIVQFFLNPPPPSTTSEMD